MLLWTLVYKYPFILLGIYLELELLDQIIILFNFWRTHQISHSSFTILHSHQQCTISPHPNTFFSLFLLNSHANGSEVVSSWFWFLSPQWLVIWSIFLCVYWPFVYLCIFFRETPTQALAHFWTGLFCCWAVVLYIFQILITYQT